MTGICGVVVTVTERLPAKPMRYTPSTLPTRSTTAIVALALRACASATAWAITCCTSAAVRFEFAVAQLPVQFMGVVSVPVVGVTGEPPEHPTSNAVPSIKPGLNDRDQSAC